MKKKPSRAGVRRAVPKPGTTAARTRAPRKTKSERLCCWSCGTTDVGKADLCFGCSHTVCYRCAFRYDHVGNGEHGRSTQGQFTHDGKGPMSNPANTILAALLSWQQRFGPRCAVVHVPNTYDLSPGRPFAGFLSFNKHDVEWALKSLCRVKVQR